MLDGFEPWTIVDDLAQLTIQATPALVLVIAVVRLLTATLARPAKSHAHPGCVDNQVSRGFAVPWLRPLQPTKLWRTLTCDSQFQRLGLPAKSRLDQPGFTPCPFLWPRQPSEYVQRLQRPELDTASTCLQKQH
ncbi:unnamed protein product [Effrenium voratum]|nr:unnamed protein product [Effrenium voratum]